MVAHFQIKNSTVISKILEVIRKQAKEGNGVFLRRIDDTIRWGDIRNTIIKRIPILSTGSFEHHDVLQLFKCLIIGNIYDLNENQIPFEIADRKSYQNFIELLSSQSIPDAKIISAFKMLLEKYDLYDELFDNFYEQLLESKLKIMAGSENILNNEKDYTEDNLIDFNKYKTNESSRMDDKVNEIESKIRKLYEKKAPTSLGSSGIDSSRANDLREKLMDVEKQIKNIYTEDVKSQFKSEKNEKSNISDKYSKDTKDLLERLNSIDERIKKISSIATNLDDRKEFEESVRRTRESEDLYKKLYNSFYNQTTKSSEYDNIKDTEKEIQKEIIIKDKLKAIDSKINEIKESLNSLYESKSELDKETKLTETEEEAEILEDEVEKQQGIDETIKVESDDKIKIEAKKITKHGVLVLTPKAKKEGIFNDANLTEDYELGYRFYELGFKTGFFNIKLDKKDDATRIATAEFFPNTFWTSVKQRSRWIAGICFQNWKSHKWKGNLSTKYFLFRDRKSIFSFFGAFLSNVVILYFLYAIIANLFHFKYAYSLVSHSSVLWYLMIANLIFMISRASHRFIFTYNWYGFKYAFFSFFRLILDTFINFFAIIRSISVFRKTKKKVVWDATSHY